MFTVAAVERESSRTAIIRELFKAGIRLAGGAHRIFYFYFQRVLRVLMAVVALRHDSQRAEASHEIFLMVPTKPAIGRF